MTKTFCNFLDYFLTSPSLSLFCLKFVSSFYPFLSLYSSTSIAVFYTSMYLSCRLFALCIWVSTVLMSLAVFLSHVSCCLFALYIWVSTVLMSLAVFLSHVSWCLFALCIWMCTDLMSLAVFYPMYLAVFLPYVSGCLLSYVSLSINASCCLLML